MSNLFNDLANGKYKLKGTNTVNNTNQSQNSKGNLFNDLANGKYKLKEAAPTSAASAQNSAVNKSGKPTNPSDLLKRVTVTDYPTINKLATQQEQQRKEAERQEQERWNNLSVGEKITDPFKTMGANITYGDLGIKENVAWNEYRSKQDDASLQAAQAATKAREDFEAINDRIGKGNAVTKDFAQYLPQLGGQLKAGAVGAAGGAGAGAAGGAGIALAAGQLGPQVAVPEEIATVPAGALTGAIWGGRGGYVAGTAKYSYDMMAGSAYKTLLDMGVPNDVALELSGDEALVNSLIEGGGAIVDLISLGFGKLVGKGGTTAAKEVAKNRLLAAAKAYGLNLVSEPLEEMAQEKVSIETEKRAADKTGIARNVTSAEDWERIKGAGETALKVAAVSGALNAGGNYITNNIGGKIASNAKSNVSNSSQMQDTQQPNTTLPIQEEMAQKANMEQTARNRKNTLENKINSNKYLSQQEKNDLIAMLNTTNVTTEVEAEIDNILNTVNNEFGLKNITSDFEANKSNYTKYLNDKTEIDNSYIDSAKNAISTKDGKRTKEQWLSVAKNLGNQIYEMSDGDVEKYAYRTWIENRPNNAQNLNRQGKKYVKFGLDEWVNAVYDSVRDARNRTTETTGNLLPTQRAETTLQSAKVAGANDINMNKAIELNNLLKSGAEVKFYNPQNIPQGVDANKAKVANGFYSNGTVWINKNTKNAVEVVLGHELTHHLEQTDSYTDLANTILDSDVFYEYITEKGYSNVAEYKQSLGQNYTAEQFDSEMVANFVQDRLFSDQNSIDRLARQNTNLVEKIKNWISDLVVSFKGTAQEKELRRIEGMYRKALEQARNSTATSTDTQYSVGGVIGARNIQKNPEYRNIMTDYREANQLLNNGATNRETIRKTGWFKDTDGNVKYEFTDEDMALKDSYKFDDNKVYPLEKILKHDILFEAYPQLRDYTVLSMDIGDTHRAAIFSPLKVILLNNQKLKTREQVEYSLIHEIQHAIQNIEGFPGARTNINGKYAYYTSLGEIESRNTSDRLRMLAEERRQYIPETAKENPTHPSLEKYLKTRKQADIEKDNKYIAKKERTEALKESVKKFMEGRIGFDDFEENNNSNIYKTTSEDDKLSSRIDGGRRLADAGKEPAFSMPETDNQGRTLSKEQQEFFKDSKVRDEEGNLQVMYHGTPNGTFTEFRSGTYFTSNKNYADKYQSQGASSLSYKTTAEKPSTYEVYLNIKNPFDTRNDKERKIFENEYYRKWGTGTPLMRSGLPDWTDGMDLQEFIEENGYDYDGLVLDEGAIGGYGDEVESRGLSYVVFNPEQVKNVNNTKPTSNPDIRYSMNPVDVAKNPSNPQNDLLEEIAPIDEKKLDDVEEKERVASILTRSPKRPAKDLLKQSVDVFMRKLVDAGNTINTVGKLTGDKHLYEYFNNTKQARQSAEYMIGEAQTDIRGNRVGNSLIRIFESVRAKGDDYTNKFFEYLLHMHNIDRMAQNKPVFGKSVTAEDSSRYVKELLEKYPEFEKQANKVYAYNRNLMQWRVDSGLISQEQADLMNQMYPHYVPTFRDVSGTSGSRAMQGTVQIANTVRKATGSDKDIMPIDASMARQTMQTVQAAKRNLLGNRLLNDVLNNKDKVGEYVQAVEKVNEKNDVETELESAKDTNLDSNNNVFKIFRNGETYVMKVNNGIYEGLKSISSEIDNTDTNLLLKPVKAVNNAFKKLITGYSPMFTLKNFSRDIQDAGFYSKELKGFLKKYPNTYQEMMGNGKMWQLYKSLGGTGSSVFDYETGIEKELDSRNKASTKIKEATVGKVEELNMMIEQAPRFAEFMATIEKAGNKNYDTLMEAMLNAADITVNFGRSGTWGKALNSTFVPFFNPSIQGFDKSARTILESNTGKKFAKLAIRATLLGILPSVINELLYWDDDEYENLTDRDKDTNFLIKVGDNKWLKIPKGRVLSIFGNTATRGLRTLKGEKWDLSEYAKNQVSQTAPISVFDSNLYSPIQAVQNNKTWYGSDIVPQRLQDYAPKDQYDENTDAFSKWLGGKINYSPKKINYLIDAYTGIIGDVVLPLMTPKAETNPFTKAFVLDGVSSNEISNDFYDMMDKYNTKQNPKKSAKEVSRYLNKQSKQVSDIFKQVREVENSDLSDAEKRKQVRELRELANTIELTTMAIVPEYEKAVDKYRGTFPDEDVDSEYAYLYANRDVFGAEYAVKTFSKALYNNHQKENMDRFFNNYFTKQYFQKKIEPETKSNSLPTQAQQKAKLKPLKK